MTIAWQNRTLALAGLLQATYLVHRTARTGMLSQDDLEACLASIFVQSPQSISDVYQGTRGVRTGLRLLGEVLTRFDREEHGEPVRYLLAMLNLERKLARQPAMLDQLGASIATIDRARHARANGTDGLDRTLGEDTVRQLALLYESTLAKIEPRIQIHGQRRHLEHPDNIQRIRALLLAAMRSAVLWHQVGGRRWHLLFNRGAIKAALVNLT